MSHRSAWIRPDLRIAIYLRDEYQCVYCGVADGGLIDPLLTLDHLTPRARGGTNSPRNLVTACANCNEAKGAMTVEEFCESLFVERRTACERAAAIRKQARRRLVRHRRKAKEILAYRRGWDDALGAIPF